MRAHRLLPTCGTPLPGADLRVVDPFGYQGSLPRGRGAGTSCRVAKTPKPLLTRPEVLMLEYQFFHLLSG